MLKAYYILPLLLLSTSCIETFEIVTGKTGEALVIEAQLTDESKIQEISVSYTNSLDAPVLDGYALDSILIDPAKGARVWLEDETNDRGIQIFVDSQGATGRDSWFRYEWEDAFEFHAPYISKFMPTNDPNFHPGDPLFIPRTDTVHICFQAKRGTGTILATTQGQTETRILEQPIRFLDEATFFPIFEYTLKLRPYSISSNAYQYYKELKENNVGAGTFFDKQKGAIQGNIHPVSSNEAVLGYFELARVEEQQIYYTADDFSSRFDPDYGCAFEDIDTLAVSDFNGGPWIIIDSIAQGISAELSEDFETRWIVRPFGCANCRNKGNFDKPPLLETGIVE